MVQGVRSVTEEVSGTKTQDGGKSPNLAPCPHRLGLVQIRVPEPVVLVVPGNLHFESVPQCWNHCLALAESQGRSFGRRPLCGLQWDGTGGSTSGGVQERVQGDPVPMGTCQEEGPW